MLIFYFFDQHLDHITDYRWWFAFFPFVLMDRTFTLETNVDDYEFVIDFYDLAFDDLVDVELAICILEMLKNVLFCGIAEERIQFLL